MFKGVWVQFQTLLSSPIFLACVSSWFLAQFLKTLIKLFAGKVHSIKELVELLIWRTGGMPSSHSALVACLCTCIGITEGFNSGLFVLSFCFFMVTIRDAVGVRRANGIQANMINRIGNLLKDQGLVQESKRSSRTFSDGSYRWLYSWFFCRYRFFSFVGCNENFDKTSGFFCFICIDLFFCNLFSRCSRKPALERLAASLCKVRKTF